MRWLISINRIWYYSKCSKFRIFRSNKMSNCFLIQPFLKFKSNKHTHGLGIPFWLILFSPMLLLCTHRINSHRFLHRANPLFPKFRFRIRFNDLLDQTFRLIWTRFCFSQTFISNLKFPDRGFFIAFTIHVWTPFWLNFWNLFAL